MENSLGVKVGRQQSARKRKKKKKKKKNSCQRDILRTVSIHPQWSWQRESVQPLRVSLVGDYFLYSRDLEYVIQVWQRWEKLGAGHSSGSKGRALFGVKGSSTLLFLVNKQSLCIPYDPVNEQIIMLHYSDLERVSWPSCGIPWSCSHHSKRHKSVQVWIRMDKHCIHGTHWLCFSS